MDGSDDRQTKADDIVMEDSSPAEVTTVVDMLLSATPAVGTPVDHQKGPKALGRQSSPLALSPKREGIITAKTPQTSGAMMSPKETIFRNKSTGEKSVHHNNRGRTGEQIHTQTNHPAL